MAKGGVPRHKWTLTEAHEQLLDIIAEWLVQEYITELGTIDHEDPSTNTQTRPTMHERDGGI